MKRFSIAILTSLWLCTFAAAADNPALLPKSFAGWTQTGQPQTTTNPAQVDSAYPAVLQEYGFADSETASYTRKDGRKLTLKAARFNDATGAYGAFTFYRQPVMSSEEIGWIVQVRQYKNMMSGSCDANAQQPAASRVRSDFPTKD